jgi:hypothetical protein
VNKKISNLAKDNSFLDLDVEDFINDLELAILEEYKNKHPNVLYALTNQKELYFLTREDYKDVVNRMESFLRKKATDKQINYIKILLKEEKKIKLFKPLEFYSKHEASKLINELKNNN